MDAKEETIVYVITEKEHINLLPANALKVLVTADLDTIKERFKKRMHNNLPKPVEQMLERKHGMFDLIDCDVHLKSMELKENVGTILKTIDSKKV